MCKISTTSCIKSNEEGCAISRAERDYVTCESCDYLRVGELVILDLSTFSTLTQQSQLRDDAWFEVEEILIRCVEVR